MRELLEVWKLLQAVGVEEGVHVQDVVRHEIRVGGIVPCKVRSIPEKVGQPLELEGKALEISVLQGSLEYPDAIII
jgi:hypothetical protein